MAGQLHVFVDAEDVTGKIRTEEIGILASNDFRGTGDSRSAPLNTT